MGDGDKTRDLRPRGAAAVATDPSCDTEAPTCSADFLGQARRDEPSLSVDEIEVVGEQLGRYHQLGQEGCGGQARVLSVLDTQLGREVALKELVQDDPRSVRRFLLEARVAARLEHPNTVPVHELGRRPDGRLYYTMRLVRGETLSKKLSACHSLVERLSLLGAFWDICKAVAYAHSRGVIHRDLKPSNVMLGEYGETILLDWGVAKLTDEAAEQLAATTQGPLGVEVTGDGMAVGTPSYMSPEQARGEAIDERTDVWGLGAVLYQLLAGKAPHAASSSEQSLARAIEGGVRPVRSHCPEAPPELAAIAHKALQKDKRHRYQTAKELADEISAYMTGGRVRAYSYSPWELLRRFALDHKASVIGTAIALFAVIAALVVVSVALGKETVARARAEQERLAAELNLAGAYAERADRLIDDFRYASAYGFAARSLLHNPAHPKSPGYQPAVAAEQPHSRELRVRAASAALMARQHFGFDPLLSMPVGDALGNVSFSPDGALLLGAAYDGTARVWDARTGVQRLKLKADGVFTYAAAFSPDGRTVATAGLGGEIGLWRTQDGKKLAALRGHAGAVRGLAFSPDGTLLASAGADGTLRLWDLPSGAQRASLGGGGEEIRSVAFAGGRLLSGGIDQQLLAWDLSTLRASVLATFASPVRSIAPSPDGTQVAVGLDDRNISILDALTGAPRLHLIGNESFVRQVAWSADGNLVASAGLDRTVRVWSSRSGEPLATLEEHGAIAGGVAFSPDGSRLASGSFDGSLRLWQRRAANIVTLAAGETPVLQVAFAPDGRHFATASRDKTLRIWDLERRTLLHTLDGELSVTGPVSFSPDGKLVASAGGAAEIWQTDAGKLLRRLPLEAASVVRFAPDGRTVATGEDGGSVALWDVESGKRLRELAGHEGMVFDLAFSPDGSLLASAGKDGKVKLWEAASGALRTELTGHSSWVTSVAFSAEGRLASGGKDGQAILWALKPGEKELRLAHGQWVSTVRFVPGRNALATACDDQYLRYWDTTTGELALILRSGRELVAMDLSPDGRSYAVTTDRGFSIAQVDFSAADADPFELQREARTRGFAEADQSLVGTPPAGTRER